MSPVKEIRPANKFEAFTFDTVRRSEQKEVDEVSIVFKKVLKAIEESKLSKATIVLAGKHSMVEAHILRSSLEQKFEEDGVKLQITTASDVGGNRMELIIGLSSK